MHQPDLFQNPPAAMRPMPAGGASQFPPDSARPARNASTGHPDQRGRRETSRDALAKHRATGKLSAQEAAVVAFLRLHADRTRSEIAQATGIRLSAVCGRVRALVVAGVLLELPRRECAVTGESAHPVRAA